MRAHHRTLVVILSLGLAVPRSPAAPHLASYPAPETVRAFEAEPLGGGAALLIVAGAAGPERSTIVFTDDHGAIVDQRSVDAEIWGAASLSDGRIAAAVHVPADAPPYENVILSVREGEDPVRLSGLATWLDSGTVVTTLGIASDGLDRILVVRYLHHRGSVSSDMVLLSADGRGLGLGGLESGGDPCCSDWKIAGFPAGGFGILHDESLRVIRPDGTDGWALSLPAGVRARDVAGRADGRLLLTASDGTSSWLIRLGPDGSVEAQWSLPPELLDARPARDPRPGVTLTTLARGAPDQAAFLRLDDAGRVTWGLAIHLPQGARRVPDAVALADGELLVTIDEPAAGGGFAPWVARISAVGELPATCAFAAPFAPGPLVSSALATATAPTAELLSGDVLAPGTMPPQGAMLIGHDPACAGRSAPGEVSGPGEVPLRVTRGLAGDGVELAFPLQAEATAYGVIGGALASWPEAAPFACHETSWSEPSPGQALLPADIAGSAWFVVVAANDVGEGPGGTDSFGFERGFHAGWQGCGPHR